MAKESTLGTRIKWSLCNFVARQLILRTSSQKTSITIEFALKRRSYGPTGWPFNSKKSPKRVSWNKMIYVILVACLLILWISNPKTSTTTEITSKWWSKIVKVYQRIHRGFVPDLQIFNLLFSFYSKVFLMRNILMTLWPSIRLPPNNA